MRLDQPKRRLHGDQRIRRRAARAQYPRARQNRVGVRGGDHPVARLDRGPRVAGGIGGGDLEAEIERAACGRGLGRDRIGGLLGRGGPGEKKAKREGGVAEHGLSFRSAPKA